MRVSLRLFLSSSLATRRRRVLPGQTVQLRRAIEGMCQPQADADRAAERCRGPLQALNQGHSNDGGQRSIDAFKPPVRSCSANSIFTNSRLEARPLLRRPPGRSPRREFGV